MDERWLARPCWRCAQAVAHVTQIVVPCRSHRLEIKSATCAQYMHKPWRAFIISKRQYYENDLISLLSLADLDRPLPSTWRADCPPKLSAWDHVSRFLRSHCDRGVRTGILIVCGKASLPEYLPGFDLATQDVTSRRFEYYGPSCDEGTLSE